MTEEIWKPVPSIPQLEASSLGRVRPVERVYTMPNGGERKTRPVGTFGSITKASKLATHTYRTTYYRGVGNVKIHRAVCEAFHGPAPFDGAVVMHLDEDAHNNKPDNLRWGTQKENLNMPKFRAYCSDRPHPRWGSRQLTEEETWVVS